MPPHSPYTKAIFPPIGDLKSYKQALNHFRADFENQIRNKGAEEDLIGIGEDLLEHCEFLDEKLTVKVRVYRLYRWWYPSEHGAWGC